MLLLRATASILETDPLPQHRSIDSIESADGRRAPRDDQKKGSRSMKTLMTTMVLAAALGTATVALATSQKGFFDPRNQHNLATPDRGAQKPYALTGSDRSQSQIARQAHEQRQTPYILLNRSVGARPIDDPTNTR
ncbi:MAG: hypothetical protein AB1689_02480 [Thermodesulfobacteriota bacterium]